MTIMKLSPMRDLFSMRDMMEDAWSEDCCPRFSEVKEFIPAVDVYQTDKEVVVETALPGIEPEKVDISVEDDTLIIKGKIDSKEEEKKKDYYRKEVRYGSFYRAVALPTSVESETAEADYENGILKITLPKVEKPEAKKIAIKVKENEN
ncbi:MAG: Hsp20/alpha crystallin family protein [Patescibacteria group bacterium]|nr:Hsp20/alpha crystallin family protein [Patescibacteria group bacterium]